MHNDRDAPSDTLESRFCALLCVTGQITSQLIKDILTTVLCTLYSDPLGAKVDQSGSVNADRRSSILSALMVGRSDLDAGGYHVRVTPMTPRAVIQTHKLTTRLAAIANWEEVQVLVICKPGGCGHLVSTPPR